MKAIPTNASEYLTSNKKYIIYIGEFQLKKIKITRYVILRCIMIAIGNFILAFGLYNVHAQAAVTEGGVLGANLLLKYWFNISPAYSSLVINGICFAIGWRILGTGFLGYSAVAGIAFSISYRILECFEPLIPSLAPYPAAASIAGALFVGIGVGISIRAGGATGGDDAIAMAISKKAKIDIRWLYLVSDVSILLLSLSYIPFQKIFWSLVTVILSGQIIGLFQKVKIKNH